MKKFAKVFLGVSLTASMLLAGCGGSSSSKAASEAAASSAAVSAASEAAESAASEAVESAVSEAAVSSAAESAASEAAASSASEAAASSASEAAASSVSEAAASSAAETEAAASAAEETTVSGEGIKVGYSCVDMNNTFQTYLVSAAQKKAEEMGAEITVTDAQNDVVKQQDQVNALIQQGVNCLVVVPADSSAMAPITQAAADKGIPLVYCNVNPFADESEIPDGVHYVGSDSIEAGIMQGEMIGPVLQSGKVAILQGELNHEATYMRTQGVKDVFAESYPDIEVIAEETAEWQRDKAIDVVNNWLSTYGTELNAICANNDEMALGAVEALKKANRTDVLVVGVDATPDGCASVKAGEMMGTVYQDSVGQGGGAVQKAIEMAQGVTPESGITWIPYVPVTQENVDEFIGLN
ncbi:MAG: substrate-binding domain-containing protein [Blautia sp.]|nr:substrate-binding domain-containing protein [Blautia sp.]